MVVLESLPSLFFELSNEERLEIIKMLAIKPEKFTNISEKLDMNSQQCSRHLTRLIDTSLIGKLPSGSYYLTNYGKVLLAMSVSFEFASSNKHYLSTHNLNKIPSFFIARLGDLQNSHITHNVMNSISEFELIIREAEEFLSVIINKRTRSVRPFVAEAVRRGVKLRSISPISYVPEVDVKRDLVVQDELDIIKSEAEGLTEVADTDIFDVYLWVSEKTAFISFPLDDGTFDYTGFLSTDQHAISFCKDLFDYYWSRSRIIPSLELVDRHMKYCHYYEVYPKFP